MINNYEVVYIVKKEINDLGPIQKKVEELFQGKVTKHELWETKIFAYPIKKELEGHYVILNVLTEGSHIKEFNDKVKFIKEILRSLIINLDTEKKFKVSKRKIFRKNREKSFFKESRFESKETKKFFRPKNKEFKQK